MTFFTPHIDIKPSGNQHNYDYPANINWAIGKIKDEFKIEAVLDKLHMNQAFIDYNNTNSFLHIYGDFLNQLSKNVIEYFDIFGGFYLTTIDEIEYTIHICSYRIKQPELINQDIINRFYTIFQYDYFTKNNILNMTWHNYQMHTNFVANLNKQKFFDFSFESKYTLTKLFNHQKNNIIRMLNIHHNPRFLRISNTMPIYFENNIIYDMGNAKFIELKDVPEFSITSGMIIDEPGTGKTLQFILYLLETKLKSLILVPNDRIKLVWQGECAKHIHPDMLDKVNFDIITFQELEAYLTVNKTYLHQYEIIGIDEIHNLYKEKMQKIKRQFEFDLFHEIVVSPIKYRWGITGTPFVCNTSLFQIIRFITGCNFGNERIANNPELQQQIMNMFLKNCKIDMITSDYQWPEIYIHDVYVELDVVQATIYNTEKMINTSNLNLRKLVCEINLMFNDDNDIKTPSQLKEYGIQHYKKIYEVELAKLEQLKLQLQNIKTNQDNFKEDEFQKRVKHYEKLLVSQTEITANRQSAYNFCNTSIEKINEIFTNHKAITADNSVVGDTDASIDDEENDNVELCPICFSGIKPPIKYFKVCGHYMCNICFNYSKNMCQSLITDGIFSCPMCRTNNNINEDIITVNDICEINNSSKIHKLLSIINDDKSDNYIIFTQFNKVISKIKKYLEGNNISSNTIDLYTNEKILILSSEQNAEGICLSMFSKMIIFEPFEDNIYCTEVEKQLIARIHRIGRTEPVHIYRFITAGTIEETIYQQFKNL